MTYGAFLLSHPLFWATTSGVALGLSLASSLRDTTLDRSPMRAKSRKWTGAALWATIAVVAAVGGVFIPEGSAFFSWPSLYAGLGALVFCALAFRFPRAGGIPAFFIVALVSIAGPLVVRPFVPIRGEGVAATVRLLALDESAAYVEAGRDDRDLSIEELNSSTVVAVAHYLEISDYLFFLGAEGGILHESLETELIPAPNPMTVSDPYADVVIAGRLVEWLPLLSIHLIRSEPQTLTLLRETTVVGLPNGTVELRPVDSDE